MLEAKNKSPWSGGLEPTGVSASVHGGTCPPHILNWGGQSPPRFEYLRFIILLILLGAQALKQYSSMREAPKHATGKANVAKVCYKSCKLSPYFARCEDTLPQLVNCHCWTIACSDIW